MAHSMDELINTFAIRSFRETADKDYITARMAFRARLIQPYRWSALHCLEKYAKCILVLNRVNAKNLNHSVLPGIQRMSNKFPIELSEETTAFIKNLEEEGADDRYYLTSYVVESGEVVKLDRAVWELRRYCQPLDYMDEDSNGVMKSVLHSQLERLHRAKDKVEKGTCISNGVLENILADKKHPARDALVWKNLYFGPSRRRGVKMPGDSEYGNSTFFVFPECIDSVEPLVHLPKGLADEVRKFAALKAAKRVSLEGSRSKAAK